MDIEYKKKKVLEQNINRYENILLGVGPSETLRVGCVLFFLLFKMSSITIIVTQTITSPPRAAPIMIGSFPGIANNFKCFSIKQKWQ
jgi:hypothetical protein